VCQPNLSLRIASWSQYHSSTERNSCHLRVVICLDSLNVLAGRWIAQQQAELGQGLLTCGACLGASTGDSTLCESAMLGLPPAMAAGESGFDLRTPGAQAESPRCTL